MKSSQSDLEQRYLLLFKLDAKNLFDRVYNRRKDYVDVFSLKRNRAVFREIFSNRYEKASIADLSHCPAEVIETLNQYYNTADNIYWYLKHTQDMPNMIEDEVIRRLNNLKMHYETLSLYIDAALSGEDDSEDDFEVESVDSFESIPAADVHEEYFRTEGEIQEREELEDYILPEEYPDPDQETSD